jgi:hypothetical protein
MPNEKKSSTFNNFELEKNGELLIIVENHVKQLNEANFTKYDELLKTVKNLSKQFNEVKIKQVIILCVL